MRCSAWVVLFLVAPAFADEPVRGRVLLLPADPAPAMEPADCSAEALKLFSTKVQPILSNACAGCHAGNKGGSFDLRGSDLQFNLAAAAKQLDRANIAKSPLLLRAVTAHGG